MRKVLSAPLACTFLFMPIFSVVQAGEAENGESFDSGFLFHPANQSLPPDLSMFRYSNRVLPGLQHIKIDVNNRSFGEHAIDFIKNDDAGKDASPCLSTRLLNEVGIKTTSFVEYQDVDENDCVDLGIIPAAAYTFNAATATLSLSVPQAALDQNVRGAIPVDMWNHGETALWASYQLSHFKSSTNTNGFKNDSRTTFLGLRAGFNLGPWRFRSNGSLYDDNGKSSWSFNDNYLERDISTWRSRIRLGDSTTNSSTFNAVRIRGIKLESDDSMLATSEQGYAPTVEGFANSSAKITVRQNGNVIYSTFVAPGPFAISDLYAVPGGGDLEVEIEETGGQITRYLQPYSVLPAMLRQGRWQYSASLGQYRGYNHGSDEPVVGQLSFAHGLPAGITVYGGTMFSKRYMANSLGLAFNLREFGGISTDIVHSHAEDRYGNRINGHAIRVQYAKNLQATGTNFRLFGYRYSSKGYRGLHQILSRQDNQNDSHSWNKSREYQFSVSQSLGKYGALSASYAEVQFHNNVRASNSLNIGYSKQISAVGLFISYNTIESQWQRKNRNIMLSLSIPLGVKSTYAGYSFSRQNNGSYSHDASLTGSALENNALSYSLRTGLSKETGEQGKNLYASTSYKGSDGQASVSIARNHENTQTQFDVSGSLVVDKKGVLFGQYLNDTAIIVDAPGAAEVTLQSHPSIKTNQAGRALIPYASPYRENNVALAPDYHSEAVTLQQNAQSVVPTKGAIVRVIFKTERGRSYLFTLKQNGQSVPFGSAVYDQDGEQKGIVGPVGRLWMTGLDGVQTFSTKWGGNDNAQACSFTIDANGLPTTTDTIEKELTCE